MTACNDVLAVGARRIGLRRRVGQALHGWMDWLDIRNRGVRGAAIRNERWPLDMPAWPWATRPTFARRTTRPWRGLRTCIVH